MARGGTFWTLATLAVAAAMTLTFELAFAEPGSSSTPKMASGTPTPLSTGSPHASPKSQTQLAPNSGGTLAVVGALGSTPRPEARPRSTMTSTPTTAATPTPTQVRTPRPTPSPTPGPTPSPTPEPTPAPTPPPTPSSGACQPGTFPTSYFGPDFEGPISRTFSEQFIVDEGSYVETCYPAGSSSPSSGDPGGAQAQLQISAGPSDSYTLSYELRFPVGFTWVLGGKLPGLCGGECWTGSDNGPGGWSARFMWRADGAAEVLLSDATTTGDGTDLGRGSWDWLADGEFHLLTETVTLNTGGSANGTIVVSYNGVRVADFTGITFNTASEPEPIDALMFTTFFGGDDSSWAPTTVQHIDFSNFSVG